MKNVFYSFFPGRVSLFVKIRNFRFKLSTEIEVKEAQAVLYGPSYAQCKHIKLEWLSQGFLIYITGSFGNRLKIIWYNNLLTQIHFFLRTTGKTNK